MAKKNKAAAEEEKGKPKRQAFVGEWFVNNSGFRQVLRNRVGDNVVMENGDVAFILAEEKSMTRVCRKQSHFMRYRGPLVGKHCIFPEEEGTPKMIKPALQFNTINDVIDYGLHEDLMTERTWKAIEDLKAEQAQARAR